MMMTAILLAGMLVQTQDLPPEKHQKGEFTGKFSEHHPRSAPPELCKRIGWNLAETLKSDPGIETWKLEDETFQIVVPESYDPAKSHGLLVWISPMDAGNFPVEWKAVLEARGIIAIGANHSGNNRGPYYRLAMALDVVHNMEKRYTLDQKRIYVTGFSGGGRSASRCGLAFPDVFRGGIYQGGTDFYRGVPDPADPKREFPPKFIKPQGDLFDMARKESRHVLIAGSRDFNHPSSKAIFEAMMKDQFVNVEFHEMPDEGHVPATAEWLGKALDYLDADPRDAKPKR